MAGEAIKLVSWRVDIRVFFGSPDTIGRHLDDWKYVAPTISRGDVACQMRYVLHW